MSSSYSSKSNNLPGGLEIQKQQQHHCRGVIESNGNGKQGTPGSIIQLQGPSILKKSTITSSTNEGTEKLGHVCQLHNETLNHCLEEAGTYLCQVYANRSYIIRKLGSHDHSLREEIYPLETKARITVNSDSIIWESNEDLCTFYRAPESVKSLKPSKPFISYKSDSNLCDCCLSQKKRISTVSTFTSPVSFLSFSQPPPILPSNALGNHSHCNKRKEVLSLFPEIQGNLPPYKKDLYISYTTSSRGGNSNKSAAGTKSVSFLPIPSVKATTKKVHTAATSFDVNTETTCTSKSPKLYTKLKTSKKVYGKSSEGSPRKGGEADSLINNQTPYLSNKSREHFGNNTQTSYVNYAYGINPLIRKEMHTATQELMFSEDKESILIPGEMKNLHTTRVELHLKNT